MFLRIENCSENKCGGVIIVQIGFKRAIKKNVIICQKKKEKKKKKKGICEKKNYYVLLNIDTFCFVKVRRMD